MRCVVAVQQIPLTSIFLVARGSDPGKTKTADRFRLIGKSHHLAVVAWRAMIRGMLRLRLQWAGGQGRLSVSAVATQRLQGSMHRAHVTGDVGQ